jgi:hypothetical protein
MIKMLGWAFSIKAPFWATLAAFVLITTLAMSVIFATVAAILYGFGILAVGAWLGVPFFAIIHAYNRREE